MIVVRPEGPPAGPAPRLDTAAAERAHRAASARNASARRRQIDPMACDRDYSAAERKFMGAMDASKRQSGRMFPTWSEVLEVLRDLGYIRASAPAGGAGAAR